MLTLTSRNVNGLWSAGMRALRERGVEQDSRNGRVIVMPTPVMSVYERPTERVLFDPLRDANPFFHLMESLWMLAGRDDVGFLDRYVQDFGSRYADDGVVHGAYGKRWRTALGIDQLDDVVTRLRNDPNDRQAVIQMWDARHNLEEIIPTRAADHDDYDSNHGVSCDDLYGDWRDRPCNTHVYLRVRQEVEPRPLGLLNPVLDLTVMCRSNDVVWGAYGANAVHFSMLQEYLAGRIGVGVGKMYQLSNNCHGYLDVMGKFEAQSPGEPWCDLYTVGDKMGKIETTPIGDKWDAWDEDLEAFMEWHDGTLWSEERSNYQDVVGAYSNEWFSAVAEPVAIANRLWKLKYRIQALDTAKIDIEADDWNRACVTWMQRRMK